MTGRRPGPGGPSTDTAPVGVPPAGVVPGGRADGFRVATSAADVAGVVCPACGGVTCPDIDMGGGTDAEWFAWCEPCAAGWFLADLPASGSVGGSV